MSHGKQTQTNDNLSTLVIGTAAYDIIVLGEPGRIELAPGGGCRNIAENLARLDVSTTLVTVVGDDDWGREVARSCEDAGVHFVASTPVGGQTPRFVFVMDTTGEPTLQVMDDRGLFGLFNAELIADVGRAEIGPSAVVVSSDIQDDLFRASSELAVASECPLALSVAGPSGARKALDWLNKTSFLFLNRQELSDMLDVGLVEESAFEGALATVVAMGPEFVVCGADTWGLFFLAKHGSVQHRRPLAIGNSGGSPLGCGDALEAGVLREVLAGRCLSDAVQFGLAAAALTATTCRATLQSLSLNSVRTVLASPSA